MKKRITGFILIIIALICLCLAPGNKPEVIYDNSVSVQKTADTSPKETASVFREPEIITATESLPEPQTAPDKYVEPEDEKKEEKKEPEANFTSLRQMYDNVNPENAEAIPITDKEHTCTLSVRCDTILSNMEDYGEKNIKAVPTDGIIYPEKEVVFYEGESVFNLLLREMKLNGIHFEFVNTPLYKTAYIEGISNIYEFDFGELSGWMYKVNGVFLRYGCSSYILKEGDRIEWVYTCDLGKDVGDFSFEGI